MMVRKRRRSLLSASAVDIEAASRSGDHGHWADHKSAPSDNKKEKYHPISGSGGATSAWGPLTIVLAAAITLFFFFFRTTPHHHLRYTHKAHTTPDYGRAIAHSNVVLNDSTHRIMSPLTQLLNRLLWGDFDKGDFGLILHGPSDMQSAKYLPASYIHASMRFKNQIFAFSDLRYASALVIGTRFAINLPMRGISQMQNEVVDIASLFPVDARTSPRGSLLRDDGGGCFPEPLLCLKDGTCLHEFENGVCTGKCNSTAVPPEEMGAHVAKYMNEFAAAAAADDDDDAQPDASPIFMNSCYYTPDRQGLESVIAASNSIWKKGIRAEGNDIGWTECAATPNVRHPDVPDAITIKVPVERNETLGDLDGYGHSQILLSLEIMHTRGYGALPVMFYTETRGMDADECGRFWGGIDCSDGFRKEFFSQPFEFTNGACISNLPGSEEFYYFPSVNRSCSLTKGQLQHPFEYSYYFSGLYWGELGEVAQNEARILGYTEDSWDNDADLSIYTKTFDDLSAREKKAVAFLGLVENFSGAPDQTDAYSDLTQCRSSCSVKR